MKITFNRTKFKNYLAKLFWVTTYFLVYMMITIAFAELLMIRDPFSINYMQLKQLGDWVILSINLGAGVLGAILFCVYKKGQNRKCFWLGQLGMLTLVNSSLFFIGQITMTKFEKLNYRDLKNAMHYVTENYYVEYAVLATAMIFMLFMNSRKGWLKKNNWYYFITMAPYILESSFIYHYQLSWQNFINMSNFSYQKLYRMLVDYNQSGSSISLLLFDDSTKPVGIAMLLCLATLIYAGGEYVVYKAQKKYDRRKKGSKTQEA